MDVSEPANSQGDQNAMENLVLAKIEFDFVRKIPSILFLSWVPVLYPGIMKAIDYGLQTYDVLTTISYAYLPFLSLFLFYKKKHKQAIVVVLGWIGWFLLVQYLSDSNAFAFM